MDRAALCPAARTSVVAVLCAAVLTAGSLLAAQAAGAAAPPSVRPTRSAVPSPHPTSTPTLPPPVPVTPTPAPAGSPPSYVGGATPSVPPTKSAAPPAATTGTAARGPVGAASARPIGPLAAGLAISAATSAGLGTAGAGTGSLSAQLGTVTVNDTRISILTGWTATVSSSAFTTGGGTTPETIGTGQIGYWSGPATATSGLSAAVPGQLTAVQAVALTVTRTAFSSGTIISLGDAASWNPTLVITLPAAAVAGTYTGTITHSVA